MKVGNYVAHFFTLWFIKSVEICNSNRRKAYSFQGKILYHFPR